MTRLGFVLLASALLVLAGRHVRAADRPSATTPAPAPAAASAAGDTPGWPRTRNGREIYDRFRAGLADPACQPGTGEHWRAHFANAPRQLASRDSDALALFGYVVDALRDASLPTEYALIPFIESGYRPGASSATGPAGLWQFVPMTAHDHAVPMRGGYDGRLSPVDSTRAAVRYLKTLHGMFAGDWRLAVMAFNAGEYRILGALKDSHQQAMHATPETLVGLSEVTRAYVRKVHALSCVLDDADDREEWMRALDRPVAALVPMALPADARTLDAWARGRGLDADLLKRLNPAFPKGDVVAASSPANVLAPATSTVDPAALDAVTTMADADVDAPGIAPNDVLPMETAADAVASRSAVHRTHTVRRGDSLWRIAKRYGVARGDLLSRNGLDARAVLRPGMVLAIDARAAAHAVGARAVAK